MRRTKNKDMSTLQEELRKLNALLHSDDLEREEKFQKLFLDIQSRYTSQEDAETIAEWTLNGYKEMNDEAEDLLQQLTVKQQLSTISSIVSLSYIAKNYFGKSAAWLSQRINGSKVRGKIYTLNQKDVETLNYAIQDISKKLGSLTITL